MKLFESMKKINKIDNNSCRVWQMYFIYLKFIENELSWNI